ncbi:hypothetical protein BaRGS_00025030, partial [Batillaria attramentaria]
GMKFDQFCQELLRHLANFTLRLWAASVHHGLQPSERLTKFTFSESLRTPPVVTRIVQDSSFFTKRVTHDIDQLRDSSRLQSFFYNSEVHHAERNCFYFFRRTHEETVPAYTPSLAPCPTDGPAIGFVYHDRDTHNGLVPADCEKCGKEIARTAN